VIQNFTYPKITILENETLFTLLLPGICYVTKQFGERACFDDVKKQIKLRVILSI
jgi:hypothetical protein